jgi:hypothetical protein
VLIYSIILISNGFLHTIIKVIENYSKGLTSQKLGVTAISEFNRCIESLKHIDIKMQSSHHIQVYAPEIKSFFELLSISLQNMKFGAEQETLHAIVSTSNLIENISDNFNLNYKKLNEVI